tara:strand:+ start:408 stop:656 length:249 start_codon:yes stop_codon:yes gene_type:complete
MPSSEKELAFKNRIKTHLLKGMLIRLRIAIRSNEPKQDIEEMIYQIKRVKTFLEGKEKFNILTISPTQMKYGINPNGNLYAW